MMVIAATKESQLIIRLWTLFCLLISSSEERRSGDPDVEDVSDTSLLLSER